MSEDYKIQSKVDLHEQIFIDSVDMVSGGNLEADGERQSARKNKLSVNRNIPLGNVPRCEIIRETVKCV